MKIYSVPKTNQKTSQFTSPTPSNEDEYVIRLPVSIYAYENGKSSDFFDRYEYWDWGTGLKVEVRYGIDIEFAGWGINGISVSIPPQTCSLTVFMTYIEKGDKTNKEKTKELHFSFDPSKLKKEIYSANSEGNNTIVRLLSVDLAVTKDFQIDYNNSQIQSTH